MGTAENFPDFRIWEVIFKKLAHAKPQIQSGFQLIDRNYKRTIIYMNTFFSWKGFRPHLFAILGFVILTLGYFSPLLEGKKLPMHDITQAEAGSRELKEYHEKTGTWANWTNSMFSGMPAYMIATDYPGSISTKIGRAIYLALPVPACILLLSLISAYVLLWTLTGSSGLSFTGAVAFAFATFNLISIEAGHLSKVMAIGYAPGVMAGVIMAYRKNWLSGAAVTGLFLSLELYANHVQITYYIGLALLVYAVLESVALLKERKISDLIKISLGLAVAALLAVGTHTTRLWNAYDYAKATIRGTSELTPLAGTEAAASKDGLDKEYAFAWSYGIGETFNLLIPNAYGGGSSNNSLNDQSETYKVLTRRGVDGGTAASFVRTLPVPLYWGDQPGTGGPAYAGAIVCFLFVLGLFLVKGRLKWWLAVFTAIYIMWAWGKNFAAINYLFFDYFPMFNKFRAVTMTMAFSQLFMVVLGILALNQIIQRKITWNELQKPLLISLGLTGGLALVFGLMPQVFFGFRGPYDTQLIDNLTQSVQDRSFAEEIVRGIASDRASLFRTDAFRTLFLILFTAGLIWLWMKDKIKSPVFYSILVLLVVVDMFGIGKRYLNNDDFVTRQQAEIVRQPTPADQEILRDTDPHFRVFDLTRSPFQSAEASFFHKSIGGYHGAKLRRYQELIERQIAKAGANPGILNMLNTKYILTVGDNGAPLAQLNPEALGNAWFVDSFKVAANADEEMAALDSLKPETEAVLDQKFAASLGDLRITPDSSRSIRLISYAPDQLVYESSAASDQLAVFSEIYYNVRDEWKVDIDGQPADLLRANYVLRALKVPAGKHTITFRFEPVSVAAGSKIDLVSSVLLILLLAGAVFAGYRNRKPAAA